MSDRHDSVCDSIYIFRPTFNEIPNAAQSDKSVQTHFFFFLESHTYTVKGRKSDCKLEFKRALRAT